LWFCFCWPASAWPRKKPIADDTVYNQVIVKLADDRW